jgi:LysR family transcriptional activator of nhaA
MAMTTLNFNHLRYFWMVAKTGSITRAAAQLHLTPHGISGQLTEFAATLGVDLFRKSGRHLELTDMGRRILIYADTIFTTGDQLLEVVKNQTLPQAITFRVGIADSVSKTIAFRLLEPAIKLELPVKLICREGRLPALLAELSVHHLDLIIADRPMPTHLHVKGYSHCVGESPLTILASRSLSKQLKGPFPACLHHAPMLLPGEDVAIRGKLLQWLASHDVHPHIVGEFDDSALMKAFAQAGAGLLAVPTVIANGLCLQYQLKIVGQIDEIREQFYAISSERRLSHPATVAISEAASVGIFAKT